jgi:hypothetical protein
MVTSGSPGVRRDTRNTIEAMPNNRNGITAMRRRRYRFRSNRLHRHSWGTPLSVPTPGVGTDGTS